MTETKTNLPALIIPREHQSAPKTHWIEPILEKSAQEIDSGNYIIPVDPEEHFNYGPTQRLAKHPRVLEALAKLSEEKVEISTQEGLEKAQMLFEINQRMQQKDQWDGQGRWLGKENEEMRKVNIITPFTFMRRLCRVIGESRVFMSKTAVNSRAALTCWLRDAKTNERKKMQVGTLQYPCGPEWMIMRVNEYGVPTTAKFLGWRTPLLAMIRVGVISEEEAHKAFPLTEGPASEWYREQLMAIRAGKKPVAHA